MTLTTLAPELNGRHKKWTETSLPPARLTWSVVFLLSYLAAITIIGKGPTYIGFPPLFWGEMVMIVSILFIAPMVIATDIVSRTSTLCVLIFVFMVLGTVLTVISFPRWGLDALRDAAIWYYATFFFVGLGLASRKAIGDRVWSLLRCFWLVSLLWNMANYLSGHQLETMGPTLPWRGVGLFFNATHEAGQNLALGAILVLCTNMLKSRPILRVIMMAAAMVGLGLFAVQSGRGMRVGIATGVLVVLLLSLSSRVPHLTRRLLVVLMLSVPLIALFALADTERFSKATNLDRFEETDEGTAAWRTVWWQRLYSEVMKNNPAFGLGFGESLAVYHPLLENSKEDFLVRSPHNFNITVFTRMGIVGLLLWLGILITGIGGLFVRVWRGMDRGSPYTTEQRDELAFWILMLLCTLVNSSLGVLMEGPVMGIWFWFALGFASARSLNSGETRSSNREKIRLLLQRTRSSALQTA